MTQANGISVHKLSGKSSLLRRATADAILDKLASSQVDLGPTIVIDFGNVRAVTPGFLDQLIGGLRRRYSTSDSPMSLCFLQMPGHAPERLALVGRGHRMILSQASAGEWRLVESKA